MIAFIDALLFSQIYLSLPLEEHSILSVSFRSPHFGIDCLIDIYFSVRHGILDQEVWLWTCSTCVGIMFSSLSTPFLTLPRKPTQLSSSLLKRPSILPFLFNLFFVIFSFRFSWLSFSFSHFSFMLTFPPLLFSYFLFFLFTFYFQKKKMSTFAAGSSG